MYEILCVLKLFIFFYQKKTAIFKCFLKIEKKILIEL